MYDDCTQYIQYMYVHPIESTCMSVQLWYSVQTPSLPADCAPDQSCHDPAEDKSVDQGYNTAVD